MPLADPQQLPKSVSVAGVGHLPETEIDAIGEQNGQDANPIAAGNTRAEIIESIGEVQLFINLDEDIHLVGIGTGFELTQPDKTRDPTVDCFRKQGQQPNSALWVDTPGDAGCDRRVPRQPRRRHSIVRRLTSPEQ